MPPTALPIRADVRWRRQADCNGRHTALQSALRRKHLTDKHARNARPNFNQAAARRPGTADCKWADSCLATGAAQPLRTTSGTSRQPLHDALGLLVRGSALLVDCPVGHVIYWSHG